MESTKSFHSDHAWALLLAPAFSLLFIGLLLHPLAPEDALALLIADGIDFLLAAGPAARCLLLAGVGLLLLCFAGASLALFGRRAARLQ